MPGHRVQIDVKFIEPLASMPKGRRGGRNKYFQFTAIDDCTRLRVLRIYPQLNQNTAIQFLEYVAERQGRTLPPHRRRGVLRLLDGVVIDDAEVFNDKLREWEDYYNYHRPHGGQTPYERLKQKTTTRA
ncbi:hypothetical protein ACIBQ5_37580 [Streptomyces massasporeus]|uniref:hypothetical protein n=1 Tax=Streptomyces massasporeus TaxID=67324 RepID=UPI0037B25E9B